ncbi:MAG: hypothetical protein JGK24_31150 [Microcoleus sp. PH2017_29_MFU_D_A]|uniref:hypothetical protein n=1 Tax=unclassified Microcoleus TaxID=2642155 RepID=UPI001D83DAA2|nr:MULTISPECIES: hypothetical protein [unclassified Microcoleus]MCC3594209.1 hypothetical protein [Microcoleus sp. PH2017_28_MFU_U_A]MCC3607567.1 hypothetical protein [Microcoleus sp. PH2017_29_MFU_D_A]MCC3638590.1 hypothetical protein [Microcoleus sp. PH2017_37_MFU_D_B]
MTSEQFSDNNAIEVSGINMEIMLPDPTALTIPENRAGITPPIELYIHITNNTSMSFHFNLSGTLIPEIVTSEGQALQRQLVNEKPESEVQPNRYRTGWAGRLTEFISNLNLSQECYETREINYMLVEPRESKTITIDASLAWENNLLALKISTKFNEFFGSIKLHNFWLFEPLLPGNYQIRFIYQHNCANRVIPEIAPLEITNVEESESELLISPFVNLRLVQPVEADSNAVEMDGVRFEILVPERVLSIPKNNLIHKLLYLMKFLSPISIYYSSFIIPVQIGIRITNNTSTPLRFSFYFTLFLEIMGVDGLIPFGGEWISLSGPSNSDVLSVMPGEDITFFPEAEIFGLWEEQFGLKTPTGNGGIWVFEPLTLETYQVRFTYRSDQTMVKIYESVETYTTLDIWSGQISTPFVDFRLVRS